MTISKRVSPQELLHMYEFCASQLTEAHKENKRYKDALEYYANENNYEDHAPVTKFRNFTNYDMGGIAQGALNGESNE